MTPLKITAETPQQPIILWPVEITEEVSIVQYNVTCVKSHYNCRLSTNFPCSIGQDCSLFIMCALIEFPVCLQKISGIISSTEANRFRWWTKAAAPLKHHDKASLWSYCQLNCGYQTHISSRQTDKSMRCRQARKSQSSLRAAKALSHMFCNPGFNRILTDLN